MSLILSGTNGLSDVDGTAATPAIRGTDTNTGIFFPSTDTIAFAEGGAEAMRIDSSGNLGVGTASPSGRIHAVSAPGTVQVKWSDATNGTANLDTASALSRIYTNVGLAFGTGAETFTERARIDTSGNLLVGKTATGTTTQGVQLAPAGGTSVFTRNGGAGCIFVGNSNQNVVEFSYSGTTVGSISIGPSSTAFNTSSDYRLKNITGPITTSGAYIDSLNPVEGTWKADGSAFVGLIAHEVQEASRTPVATGTKDGEEMQGMDYSSAEIIANMLAELKSLRARVAQLEAK